jgi:RNA polymerase sigma factor (sigma-70 family)
VTEWLRPHLNQFSRHQEPAGGFDRARWFASEIQPHDGALRNWLRVRFPGLGDREDVAQESLLRVWRAADRGPIHSGKAFLFATARNLALDVLQRQSCKEGLGESDPSTVLDMVASPAESLVHAQELEILNRALAALPERCREVFTLRRLHGLSQKEIARRLGISEKTVEAQNVIAMHKCVQFFERAEVATPLRAPATPRFVSVPPTPQHA